MRRAGVGFGLLFYLVGGASALLWISMVAGADTALARFEGPGAPALELAPGVYEIRTAGASDGSAEPSVFALRTRTPLALRPFDSGHAFEVVSPGVYVIELPADGGTRSVGQRRRLSLSPTLMLALSAAPLATLPGLFVLEAAVPARPREVVLGAATFRVASVRRRLLATVADLVAIAVILMLLILAAPLFAPAAPLFPLAPVAYVWAGNARGTTVGRWLAGLRVIGAGGHAPGAIAGFVRSAAWALSWGLLGAGYAIAVLRSSGRAPHDELARTFVVHD